MNQYPYGAPTAEVPTAYDTAGPTDYAYGAPTAEAPTMYDTAAPTDYHYGAPTAEVQTMYATPAPPVYPYPAAPVVPRMNSMALSALIFGVLGFTLLPVIFGHLALRSIKKTGERGKAMAVIGLVLGYLQIAFLAVFMTLGFAGVFDA